MIFYVSRNNKAQQKAIFRALRVKLSLKNRTAKMLAHEVMESFKENFSYGYNQPCEIHKNDRFIRFEFIIKG